jgi:hypothetical protein
MKEAANLVGTTRHMTESAQGLGFHVGEGEHAGAAPAGGFSPPSDLTFRQYFPKEKHKNAWSGLGITDRHRTPW